MTTRGKFQLQFLFCSLFVAACAPATRPDPATHAPTAASAATASTAATATTASTAGETQAVDPSQEQVCTFETVTGSRFQRRYCTTRAERERRQAEDRAMGEKMQRKGTYSNPRER